MNERIINALVGLIKRGKITIDDIKDEQYREKVKSKLEGK